MPLSASGIEKSGSKTILVRMGLFSLLCLGIPNLSVCPFRAYAITFRVIRNANLAQNYKKIRIYAKKMQKNLVMSKKSSTFAPAFRKTTIRMVPSGRKPAKRLRTEKRSTEHRRNRATRSRVTRSSDASGAIAQLVEQRTENPCVTGSIPVGTTEIETQTSLFFCTQN